uniref:TOG domain-containing protein n=1 Tax=Arcella intermedia TaxID=1963864 RepID=A0A6B2L664_9EUKA
MVSSWGVHSWPELVPSLLGCLREANPDVALGAFACLKEVLEDNAALFSRDPLGPAKSILTGVMPLCSHPDARIRTQAIGCLTLFSEYSVDVLGDLEPLYLLFIHLSNDVSIEVKRRVVVGFSILMENMNYELSSKYLVKIISIIINYINQSNEELVLEAMEFWTVLLEHLQTDTENLIAQLLPQILPAIFIRMQYSQKDVQEIALQKKTDDYYQESHWNVRKSAAYAFEVFSGRFAGLVPSVLVPMALQGVNSEEWVVREGAVLALGSVASSLQSCCPDFIAGFFPVLLKLLGDEHHLIRVITCWTLGRYSYWAKKNPNFLKQLVNSIINHMNDSNYFVQKASTTAIGEVFVEAFWELLQYSDLLNHILASFTHALQHNTVEVKP